MPVTIALERPDTADAILLIGELEKYIVPLYPHDKEHGLTQAEMVEAGVVFFIIRSDDKPAGCGGVRFHGTEYGELMRMYVRPEYRGHGLGRLVLRHIEDYSREQGVKALRLKTGIYQPEALGLYERLGYRLIQPFGSYREHPLNRYYQKILL
ncbi:GNAT family N-acetyltransferase [Methanocella sp. MCL-LM]|uniref:GNAT family N-acetyltransferase n=1 Tax=Methanocella sp. MCL-LM TaxID=3412035 RepID=UPI003C741B35